MSDLFPASAPEIIHRRAWVDGSRRWTLERMWKPGPYVLWIGHNPSTADHQVDDPTVLRWMHFTRSWGYGCLVAVNLYPFRSSTPAACKAWAKDWDLRQAWDVRDDLHSNLDIVVKMAKKAALVVPCWGAIADDDVWIEHVVEHIQTGEAPWPDLYCIGTTSSGAPKHPMARGQHRVPDDVQPILWRKAAA